MDIFLGDVSGEEKKETKTSESLDYEIIIIGGGPAGLTAALYAARSKLKTLVIEKLAAGGQIMLTDEVENYPGFVDGISGYELGQKFEEHAKKFGAEIVFDQVEAVEVKGQDRIVKTSEKTYHTKSIILATGAEPRKLNVEGEANFTGRGVSYCATCDAAFFKEKNVIVVGGGDTAVEEAIYLTKFAKKVSIVHRRDKLRATQLIQERAKSNTKIDFVWDSVVKEIKGSKFVESVVLENVKTHENQVMPIDGVFVFVGLLPQTKFLEDVVEMDDSGYVITNNDYETSVPGIFSCGDVRSKMLRQVVTAVGEGAAATFSAEHYVERLEHREYV